MRTRALSLALLTVTLTFAAAPSVVQGQTSDPRAVAILQASLVAAGGTRGLGNIQDFTATGTITYFWAGQQVTGAATVKGRGADQWRLDANLPQGTRSHAVSHGRGALKEVTGTVTQIPTHNTINRAIDSFPYLTVAAALADPLTTVSFVGSVQVGGRPANQVRVQRHYASRLDPSGILSKLSVTDYFVDAQTSLIVKSSDTTHPANTLSRSYSHDLELQNYTNLDGANVPSLVRERIEGQTVWELHLSHVSYNTGLTDADFVVQ